ncbi:hypothetical protein GWK47_022242 [Chionoecetes opilio]|uniref:HAT C-terminal dimerisation domain-containing protein n=1 Tax=Chionoecetes opilio TaxID=41210 RepID=A0A8J4XNS2_CHIOP|nr:hypothetical protein GWK47_022242 [Chionoecetes opilio]
MRRSAADPFAELCDTTQADQEDDLKRTSRRSCWLGRGARSSAAVERLFSTAGDVLRPKRACLSEDNFEYLVFLKGNLHLLKQKFKVPRGVDEEDEEMF